MRALFADRPYVSLEAANERRFAVEDPVAFVRRFPEGAVIDEAQYGPELFSALQTVVDADGRPGRFVLTGSQNFQLIERIAQKSRRSRGAAHPAAAVDGGAAGGPAAPG